MNSNETYYPDLITRYLSGEASSEEISELSGWIQSNPEHASIFDEFRKTWQGVLAYQVEQQVDLEKEWKEITPKLSGMHQEKTPNIRPVPVRKPESTSRFKLKLTRKPKPIPRPVDKPIQRTFVSPAVTPPTVDPANDMESMEETGPKVVPIGSASLPLKIILIRASLIAAIAIVLLIPTWVAYRYFTHTEVITLTASNEILDAFLPDGSMISLNAFSSLTYTEDFGKINRNIELSGEGFFEVNRDSLLPFVISCGGSRLEVLGTTFYVKSEQAAGNMEVILVDGSVSVYFENERSTGKSIIPGEKAEITQANQRIVVTSNIDPNFLAWKTRRLIFIDDRLDMIINTLNKVYQADISLSNENLASCRLTATFNRQSLESVLNVILVTLDLQAENTQPGIILYGNGCN